LGAQASYTRTATCAFCGAVFQGKPDTINRQVSLHTIANHAAGAEEAKLSTEELMALTASRMRAKQHTEVVADGIIYSKANFGSLILR